MSSYSHFAGFVLLTSLVTACDKKPVSDSSPSTTPAAPTVAQSSTPPVATASTVPPPPTAEPTVPGPASGTPDEREAAVLALVQGASSADEIPVEATEEGEPLNPELRSRLAPLRQVRIRFGAITVIGGLPKEVIQRIVRRQIGQLRRCYSSGLDDNPNLQGRVAVKLVIDKTGTVKSAQNGNSDLPDSKVVSCVVSSLNRVQFPEPSGGGIVTASIPLLFMPN
ncbi:MAG: AgmX/PglI C-terminal domain-containing protein [Polyangiaceae bacterium]